MVSAASGGIRSFVANPKAEAMGQGRQDGSPNSPNRCSNNDKIFSALELSPLSINDGEGISATSVRNSECFKRRPLAVVLGVIGGSE